MNITEHYNGKIYLNPVPTEVMGKGSFWRIMKMYMKKHVKVTPSSPPGPFSVNVKSLEHSDPGALKITWLGHSGLIIDIDGNRFLTDPLWYQRASPIAYVGPKRFFQNPINIDDLPPIKRLLISHDHYDHLDKGAVQHLAKKGIPIICLKGVGGILKSWGVDPGLITELDWWEETLVNNCTITALPARHFSGRSLFNRFHTLWGSYAIKGPIHNIYFGADSGYYDGFKKIGDRLGPFDLTMLDAGAYNPEWESIHMGPENAVKAHLDLRGKLLMPIHWGTFPLAIHPWTEPVERVIAAAEKAGVHLLLPAPGETVNVDAGGYTNRWWEANR